MPVWIGVLQEHLFEAVLVVLNCIQIGLTIAILRRMGYRFS